MSSFVDDLKKQVKKSFDQSKQEVNSLVMIGLTEAILDLGLSEEQLHFVVRSYGRQLAAQVHPDRKAENISRERQIEILEAFNILDDYSHFSKALGEFKNIKAEDRRELRIIQSALNSQKMRMAEMEKEFRELASRREALNKDIATYENLKRREPSMVPILKTQVDEQNKEIVRLRESCKQSDRFAYRWKRKTELAFSFISNLGNVSGVKTDGKVGSLEAEWVAVATLAHSLKDDYLPIDEKGVINPLLVQTAKSVGIKKDHLEEIMRVWNKAVAEYGIPSNTETKKSPLGFAFIKLTAGRPTHAFGVRSAVHGGRIIGSVPVDSHFENKRSYLVTNISQEAVMERLHPSLSEGKVLVSISSGTNKRLASWSMMCPAFNFTTKRIILAVG